VGTRRVTGICRLCEASRELRDSHIIPKFVTRHLKETSATGYLRGAEDPNIRQQDSKRIPLLCDACEQLFSAWEREFKNQVFDAVKSSDFSQIEYGPWMMRFVVSVSWRVLVAAQDRLCHEHPRFDGVVNRVSGTWRAFLLGRMSKPGDTQHHVFVLGTPSEMNGRFHPRLLHYLLRGVDATPACSQRQLWIYSKLLRVLLFSPLTPSRPAGWINTRIFAGAGRLTSPQTIRMRGFGDFLNDRVEECHIDSMSQSQLDKIRDAVMKNPEKALRSETFAVELLSQQLRGRG